MLPLWIIDITTNRDRREPLVALLRRVEHVHISKTFAVKADKLNKANQVSDQDVQEHVEDFDLDMIPMLSRTEATEDLSNFLSQQELLDQLERRAAEKDAVIKGDYWYYSAFDDVFRGLENVKSEELDDENNVAKRLYALQSRLVEAGTHFIHQLRLSNAKPYQTVNVMVLGDSTELFTQTIFPSVAAMLQKEKERILQAHIHQGMCVYGALYIPCDINSRKVEERAKVLHLLTEVEVQHKLRDVRGYDHVMLYQNVQNRTECTYSLMDDKDQAEYLFQCLVHLFYACDYTHPLISGTMSEDLMYFSMGATSIYFDMQAEDVNDASKLAAELMTNILVESDEEAVDREEIYILKHDEFDVDKFIRDVNEGLNIKLPEAEMDEPSPHPILNYMQKNLKRLYYFYYLKFFPAKLLRKISDNIERGTSDLLDRISVCSTRMYKGCEMAIHPAITRMISKVLPQEGVLAAINREFNKLQERLSLENERIREELEHNFWDVLLEPERDMVPNDQKDYFENYHDAYKQDISAGNGGTAQAEMKQQATDRLLKLMSEEQTTLSTITRVFLLGLVSVLAILPILTFVSRIFGVLGNVKDYAFFWAIGLFLIPVLIQLVIVFLYMRKKDMCIRVLKAYYLHDAYARLANRIEFEASDFYSKMQALCEAYLNRSKQIREEVKFRVPDLMVKTILPDTKFNQPLRSGRFDDVEILPASEVEGCRIRVNYKPEWINELDSKHYFLLINHFNDEIAELYKDVRVLEDHARRLNKTTQEYEFFSKEQLAEEMAQQWEEHKVEFHKQMIAGICNEMLPRENPTVGEKLLQYVRKSGNIHLLDNMISYAAANGEVICEADIECSDVKVNKDISILLQTLPSKPNMQNAEYNELYKRYLFITRWRSFDSFSYNRILPTEDFDQAIRNVRVFAEEQKAKKEQEKNGKRNRSLAPKVPDVTTDEAPKPAQYKPDISALILWAICPDDTSSEWLKLFDPSHFAEAYKDRQVIREEMNKED